MPEHRGKHEGSIYQRNDGRWVASLRVDGQRHYRYAKSVWDALERFEELKSQYHPSSQSNASQITVGEWISAWLEEIGPDLRPSTLNTYRYTLKPIAEEVGEVPLNEVTPLLLTETFTKLRSKGKGSRQLNLCHGYLKTCLKHAVNLDLLEHNPMEKVRRPKWEPKRRAYWEIEDVNRFIEMGLQGAQYWDPLFVFLCVSGLRISEALALRWSDIDWSNQRVSVSRAIVWRGSHFDELPPKTKTGYREISLPRVALDALELVRKHREGPEVDRVFTTKHGTPPRLSDLAKYLKSLCDRAGVTRVNVHGLRHVAAMLALEAVDDPYLVQKRLGHSHISVTLGIYGYTSKDESQVGQQLDRLLEDD